MNKDYDIAIIGAGPAGTCCALELRNSGLSVAIIDKSKFPRNKTCGDAVPGMALKYLKEISNGAYNEFKGFEHKQKVESSLVYLANGKSLEFRWKNEAYNSKRFSFDNFLLEQVKKHTSTSVYEGITIDNINRKGEKILINAKDQDFSITCDMVIGSDGAHSVVSKYLTNNRQQNLPKVNALSAYFKDVACSHNTNEVYLLNGFPGYFWIFPVGENLFNVGLGTYKQKKSNSINLRAYFLKIITEHPEIEDKFRQAHIDSKINGFPLPMEGKGVDISGERFLLTGDAARLIDPFSGHGIDNAMRSGMIAARHIVKCFEQKNFSPSFNQGYNVTIYDNIQKELNRKFRFMTLHIRFPWILNLLYLVIKSNQNLLRKFI